MKTWSIIDDISVGKENDNNTIIDDDDDDGDENIDEDDDNDTFEWEQTRSIFQVAVAPIVKEAEATPLSFNTTPMMMKAKKYFLQILIMF